MNCPIHQSHGREWTRWTSRAISPGTGRPSFNGLLMVSSAHLAQSRLSNGEYPYRFNNGKTLSSQSTYWTNKLMEVLQSHSSEPCRCCCLLRSYSPMVGTHHSNDLSMPNHRTHCESMGDSRRKISLDTRHDDVLGRPIHKLLSVKSISLKLQAHFLQPNSYGYSYAGSARTKLCPIGCTRSWRRAANLSIAPERQLKEVLTRRTLPLHLQMQKPLPNLSWPICSNVCP